MGYFRSAKFGKYKNKSFLTGAADEASMARVDCQWLQKVTATEW